MKNIIVSIYSQQETDPILNYSSSLASHLDSRLTCMYVEKTIDYGHYGESFGAYIAEALQTQLDEELASTKKAYDKIKDDGVNESTFIHVHANKPKNILHNLLVSDLVVTGQYNQEHASYHYLNRPEDYIMNSGRPVIVLPNTGVNYSAPNNILVAWNQTRESSLAIHTALPLLKSAESVRLLTIVEDDQEQLVNFDMGTHLANHNVNVVIADEIKTKVPIAETLLSRLADTGSELLVMGAYGHSRMQEYVFGGVTRTILSSMTVPVFMMH